MSAPIPPAVWQRIVAFVATGATGRIVLNVKCGEIRSYELVEVGDAGTPARPQVDRIGIPVKQSAQ